MARKRRENPTCNECGVALVVGENWHTSAAKKADYNCKECKNQYNYMFRGFERTLKGLYGQLRTRARGRRRKTARPVPFTLTFEDFCTLRQKPCHYCGGPLPEVGPGVDQKIAGIGYTAENALPCCTLCNIAKSDLLTYEQTVKFIGPAIRALRKECKENGTPPPSCSPRLAKFRKRNPTPPAQQAT